MFCFIDLLQRCFSGETTAIDDKFLNVFLAFLENGKLIFRIQLFSEKYK